MTTQYYEATTHMSSDHYPGLKVPDEIPPGSVRVAIIFESQPSPHQPSGSIKNLLNEMPDVGEDADFARA